MHVCVRGTMGQFIHSCLHEAKRDRGGQLSCASSVAIYIEYNNKRSTASLTSIQIKDASNTYAKHSRLDLSQCYRTQVTQVSR